VKGEVFLRARGIIVLAFVISLAAAMGCGSGGGGGAGTGKAVEAGLLPASRPFYMAMTPLQHDITVESFAEAFETVDEHCDMIAHHFDSGIPWPEALDGLAYHENVENELKFREAKTGREQKVYLAIAPLDTSREELARYWGESPGMERQGEWASKSFDDPEVIAAYLNFCRDMIGRFHPDYFNYGVEANLKWEDANDPRFEQFLVFAREVYTALKDEYPAMPVFVSLIKVERNDSDEQASIDRRLLAYSDMVAVSTYPFLPASSGSDRADPADLPEDWFSSMAGLAPAKPFAVAETAYIAEDLVLPELGLDIRGSEDWQASYVRFLLEECAELRGEFVVWFVPRDYDRRSEYMQGLPDVPELVYVWRDCGLLDGDGNARESLGIWDAWLELPRD